MAGLLRPAVGGRITQRFGPTELTLEPRGWFAEADERGPRRAAVGPFEGGERARHLHPGIDVGLPRGTALVAVESGEIQDLGRYASTRERFLVLRIRPRVFAFYTHLRSFRCEKGEPVRRGQVIALSGNSGISTGPHLHFEIRRRVGDRVFRYDPRRLFAGRDMAGVAWIRPEGVVLPPAPPPLTEADMPALLEYVPGAIATVNPPAAIRRAPALSAPLLRQLAEQERHVVIGWVRGEAAFGSERWLMWGLPTGAYEFTHEVNVETVVQPEPDCSEVVGQAVTAALAAEAAGSTDPDEDEGPTERAHDLF